MGIRYLSWIENKISTTYLLISWAQHPMASVTAGGYAADEPLASSEDEAPPAPDPGGHSGWAAWCWNGDERETGLKKRKKTDTRIECTEEAKG